MELALGLSASRAVTVATLAGRLTLATLGATLRLRFAIGFRTICGTSVAAALIVAALAVVILGAGTMGGMAVAPMRMSLLAVVAVAALLTVMTAVGLRPLAGVNEPRLLSLLGGRLETPKLFRARGEVSRERSELDPLARQPLNVAQQAALLG